MCVCVRVCAYVLEKQTTQKCLEPDALDIYFYTALSVPHERKIFYRKQSNNTLRV